MGSVLVMCVYGFSVCVMCVCGFSVCDVCVWVQCVYGFSVCDVCVWVLQLICPYILKQLKDSIVLWSILEESLHRPDPGKSTN